MDWTIVTVGVTVSAAAAVLAAVFSFASWNLARRNRAANEQYKERLRLEEHYFKLHLLWQELRVAAVMLQDLPMGGADYVPHLQGLPIEQMSEALATKDLLGPDAAAKTRSCRDILVQIEQMAGDGRNPEARKALAFEHKFPELVSQGLSGLEQARQAILRQLPE
jgi:hypothetical protein